MILLLNCRAKIDIIFIFATYLSGKIAKCFIILYFIIDNTIITDHKNTFYRFSIINGIGCYYRYYSDRCFAIVCFF